ncbi:MAG: flagellar hook-basal body complex protein FliE [Candidatus Cloacimonadales bacterium]|jgi:flagellar hook-basal body complex protein FliE|nr:flagellar hook-basal body complex protein FliE [Candidatus Cloacimonadota bacterium]MDD2650169.1 flagellar hook-basal body complex protein FliE [Candidatus Cloacimonadota bacterium]MDD3502205.1 flagellar hook-basal body complex protein FliE [Candidatus Cloacimonadota bacterium]MDX9976582.1 flagellar hook-basal body complex protein FliE [Candidatus Cloacimonadales bacterium]
MIDPRLTAINQIRDIQNNADKAQVKPKPNEKSFGETLKNYINEANDMQIEADKDIRRIIAGEEIDAHEVMTAVEKASMSFEMVMEIRNKMLEAYREIIKTPM